MNLNVLDYNIRYNGAQKNLRSFVTFSQNEIKTPGGFVLH